MGKLNVNKLLMHLNPIANWIEQNKVISSVNKAFSEITLFVMLGAFGCFSSSLLGSLNSSNSFISVLYKSTSLIGNSILGLIGPISLLVASYYYSESLIKSGKKINNVVSILLVLVTYLILLPDHFNLTKISANNPNLNSYSFFEMLFISLATISVYSALSSINSKTIKLKFFSQNFGKSIKNIFSPICVLVIFSLLRITLTLMKVSSFHNLIWNLMEPILKVTSSLPVIIIVIVLQQLLWFIGLHGFELIWKLISWLWLPVFFINITKFAITNSFEGITISPNTIANIYAMIGGSGSTLGLVLALLIFSKKGSIRRENAKTSFVPALYAVNEPLIFGFPIVRNKTMFLPWIFVPVINALIAYWATAAKLVVPISFLNIGGEPTLISTWILAGFRFSPVVLTMLLIILDIALYTPFVLLDRKNSRG